MDRHFSTALDAILKNWSALQLSLHHSGTTNAHQFNEWLSQSVLQWFKDNQNLESQEVEGFLEHIVVTEFDVEIEDGSYGEVADLICKFFQTCSTQSEDQILNELRTLPKCDLSLCKTLDDQDEAAAAAAAAAAVIGAQEDAAEDMDTESRGPVRNAPPEPDEDGFVTVVSRKKR